MGIRIGQRFREEVITCVLFFLYCYKVTLLSDKDIKMRLLDQEHRIGGDSCAMTARDEQNEAFNAYSGFHTFKAVEDDASDVMRSKISAENGLRYNNGYGVASSGVIDDDSRIRYDSKWTNDRTRQQLNKRVFTGVPNLSRGGLIANLESQLRIGDDTQTPASCDTLAEVSLFDHHITPLTPCLKKNVQNPTHIIPEWQWGGEPTRDYVRQKTFLESQGYVFDRNAVSKGCAKMPRM